MGLRCSSEVCPRDLHADEGFQVVLRRMPPLITADSPGALCIVRPEWWAESWIVFARKCVCPPRSKIRHLLAATAAASTAACRVANGFALVPMPASAACASDLAAPASTHSSMIAVAAGVSALLAACLPRGRHFLRAALSDAGGGCETLHAHSWSESCNSSKRPRAGISFIPYSYAAVLIAQSNVLVIPAGVPGFTIPWLWGGAGEGEGGEGAGGDGGDGGDGEGGHGTSSRLPLMTFFSELGFQNMSVWP